MEPIPTSNPVSSKPRNIIIFEILGCLYVLFNLISIIVFGYSQATLDSWFNILSLVYGVGHGIFELILIFLIVNRKKNWARIVYFVLNYSSIGVIFLPILYFVNPQMFSSFSVYMAPGILGFAALILLFTPSVNKWFSVNESGVAINTGNKMWSQVIPIINIISLITSALLVFGIDLAILVGSQFSLIAFWIEMLVVFVVFLVFLYLESFKLRKKFSQSSSNIDIIFVVLIIFRNLVCILNFVPVIQLGAAVVAAFAIIPFIIVYAILIKKRLKVTIFPNK